MEINFRNSSTKIYLEKSPLPKNDRKFLLECAEKVFSIFSIHSDFLRHNGERFYLRGTFFGYEFDPTETVAMNIFKVGHLKTFKSDNRFGISVFESKCFLHPDDILFVDVIFSPKFGVTVASKSIQMTMILLTCQIVNSLSTGRMSIMVNFEESRKAQAKTLKRLLCLVSHGGIIINGEKVVLI